MSFTNARRDVALVAAAKSVSWLGDEVALVALLLHAHDGGHGAGVVAGILVANALPIVLLSGVVGRLVDRHDNRALLAASSVAQAAVCAVLAFVPSQPVVLGLLALLGAGQAVNAATWSALLPVIVTAERLPRAVGAVQAGTTSAGLVAPALGGVLFGAFGTRVPLLVDAVTFLLVLCAGLAIRTRRRVVVTASGRADGGLAVVRRDPLLRPLFVLLAVFVMLGSTVNVIDVFLVRATLHASAIWYGVTGAAFSAGALSGALLAGRFRSAPTLARGFVGACAGLAIGLIAMGCAPSVVALLPVAFVTGGANGALVVALNALVMGAAAPAERGRVGALLGGVASAMQLIAFVAGGLLAGMLTPRAAFVLAGVCGLAAPVLLGRRVVRAAAVPHTADSTVMEAVA
ncbi:MAG: MFS transporter [Jatrophihabitantaceae bacterium]